MALKKSEKKQWDSPKLIIITRGGEANGLSALSCCKGNTHGGGPTISQEGTSYCCLAYYNSSFDCAPCYTVGCS
jgi:hypothetical protein